MKNDTRLAHARDVLRLEADAVRAQIDHLGAPFLAACELLLATPLAILWLTTLPAVQEKTRRYPAAYHHPANLACGLTLLILAYYNLSHDGNAAPFPYLPVLNPLELASLVALYILWRWWQTCIPLGETAQSAAVASGWEKQKNLLLGFTLWLIISLDILRIWHHYLGVPWEARALLETVQSAL